MAPALTLSELDRLLASFDWESWVAKLEDIVDPAFRGIAVSQAEREAKDLGIAFDAEDPFVTRYFTSYVTARITQLDQTTREVLKDELQRALEDDQGASMTELASNLMDVVGDSAAFSPARALMIARTETAIAYNSGAIAAFRQNGIEQVEVSDGDGDDECAEADGQIWTLDEALAEPIAHPNCVRSFAPVVPDDGE